MTCPSPQGSGTSFSLTIDCSGRCVAKPDGTTSVNGNPNQIAMFSNTPCQTASDCPPNSGRERRVPIQQWSPCMIGNDPSGNYCAVVYVRGATLRRDHNGAEAPPLPWRFRGESALCRTRSIQHNSSDTEFVSAEP